METATTFYYGLPHKELRLTRRGPYEVDEYGNWEYLLYTKINIELPGGSIIDLSDLVTKYMQLANN